MAERQTMTIRFITAKRSDIKEASDALQCSENSFIDRCMAACIEMIKSPEIIPGIPKIIQLSRQALRPAFTLQSNETADQYDVKRMAADIQRLMQSQEDIKKLLESEGGAAKKNRSAK